METNSTQKIIPNLWFDMEAEEAARFYTSLFKNSGIGLITRYGKEGFEFHQKPVGTVMTMEFEIEGYKFVALNGGPQFKLNPSVSFFVTCETEAETDRLWKSLSDKGAVLMPLDKYPWSGKYGFVQDRYGLTWQISLGKISDVGQKITPCLLFVNKHLGQAEAALQQYTKIFDSSVVDGILKYGPGEEASEGMVRHAQFSLLGEKFMVMDGAGEHPFVFNEAISFIVNCKDQEEIDYYWDRLSEGGDEKAQVCGWLKDRFGVSWQVIPEILPQMFGGDDPKRVNRMTQALFQMKKLDIRKLKEAYDYDESHV
ncbi:VOC family protein [Sinomicrobium weinanense]|uniref:VOC family protein n=1 Tax=Sinomicrobium weinanense TaxID=2842200 RepID=A0A926JTU2_9FLAO|nr:VOC family protein [Sinomicrobium weinanense]MBC9797375.1 VOC family protein [Sinomicrobium weinanense]MBU3123394.1 VOC family protein [Sinomicrobium weinanense]